MHWRFCYQKFLRQSFVEYAGESARHSFWARAFYMQQRTRGKSHQVAVRALAYKWSRIIYRCWQTRQPYNEVEYLECLRQKGSPLHRWRGIGQGGGNPATHLTSTADHAARLTVHI